MGPILQKKIGAKYIVDAFTTKSDMGPILQKYWRQVVDIFTASIMKSDMGLILQKRLAPSV
jgi:hypothetical protein